MSEPVSIATIRSVAERADQSDDPRKWLAFRHPIWRDNIGAWKYVRDHYNGTIVTDLNKTKRYLVMRAQGEVNAAFEERAKTADYTNHFGTLVDGLVGMLSNVDGDAVRQWGARDAEGVTLGLGSPEEPDTEAARLWTNADGYNTNWEVFWQSVGIELSLTNLGWILVDSMRGNAVVRYIIPEAVVNWYHDPETGALVEALIEEESDVRDGIRSNAPLATRYLLLNTTGWERYAQSPQGFAVLLGAGSWEVGWKDQQGNPTIPLALERLPMRRFVGHNLARKANAIFNKESERDNLLRTANFPRLTAPNASDTEFKAIQDAIHRGHRLIQGSLQYIAPPSDPAKLASEVLQQKIEQFYRSGFREYADSARQRTATEVMQDAAPGQFAYLTLLSGALDSAETNAMNTLTQSLYPDHADWQFAAKVTRSRDFLPMDPDAAVGKLIARVFGKDGTVPVGRTGRAEAAKAAAKMMGLATDPDEITADVQSQGLVRIMEAAVSLPWPAPLKALVVQKLVQSNGFVDPEELVTLADGTKVKLIEALRTQAERLAAMEERQTQLMGQSFPFGQPPAGPTG